RFLKKYGLDQASRIVALPTLAPADAAAPAGDPQPQQTASQQARPQGDVAAVVRSAALSPSRPLPPQEFFLPPLSTPVPSCSCPRPSIGSLSPATASPMSTARCSGAC